MRILEELKNIIRRLDAEGIEYALCGGLAMAVYAMPRSTLDVDLMIEADSLLKVRRAMQELGFALDAIPMEFHGGEIQICRLCKISPENGEELILDLLLVTPETREAWKTRCQVEWREGKLSVVSPQGLVQLKTLRGSGQDQDDIAYLRSISDEDKD